MYDRLFVASRAAIPPPESGSARSETVGTTSSSLTATVVSPVMNVFWPAQAGSRKNVIR